MSFLKRRSTKKSSPEYPAAKDARSTSTKEEMDGLKKPIGIALIVGGGPAGALTAKALADRNYDVTACESYPHPEGSEEKSHAYVISINPRGCRALRRVGIDPMTDLEGGVVNDTYVRHGNKVDSKARVIKNDEKGVIIRRQKLTADLLDIAAKAGATVVCGEKLSDIDFEKRVATFRSIKTGKEVKRTYDLLVGADGVNSVTRSQLESAGLIDPVRKEADDMEYQVAVLPNWRKLLVPTARAEYAPDISVQTYADKKANTNALVFPLDDGIHSLVTVICPGGRLGGMKQDKNYGPALESLFSNWTEEARSELANQLGDFFNVPNSGGTCIWTSTLGVQNVVLVGDSGHGMWPSLGQGCNSALESVSVLVDAVEAVVGTDTMMPSAGAGVRGMDVWDKSSGERARLVAAEYQGLRHDDALAIVNLTFDGIGGRRVRGQQNSKLTFFAKTILIMLLNKMTLGLVPMPALLRVMKGDDVPYSTLEWQNKCEHIATYAVFFVIAVTVAWCLLM